MHAACARRILLERAHAQPAAGAHHGDKRHLKRPREPPALSDMAAARRPKAGTLRSWPGHGRSDVPGPVGPAHKDKRVSVVGGMNVDHRSMKTTGSACGRESGEGREGGGARQVSQPHNRTPLATPLQAAEHLLSTPRPNPVASSLQHPHGFLPAAANTPATRDPARPPGCHSRLTAPGGAVMKNTSSRSSAFR